MRCEFRWTKGCVLRGQMGSKCWLLIRRWSHYPKSIRRKSHVVELRFFGGLNVEETAEVLEISPETVQRDWRMAKTWLFLELTKKRD